MGDPAGIGPEVIIKALDDPHIYKICEPIIIGDKALIERYCRTLGFDQSHHSLQIVDLKNVPDSVQPGIESGDTGLAAASYIEHSVKMWKQGRADAIATAPISKKALSLAGYNFPGHTEFLAELTGTSRFAMSFFAEKLRVVLLSTHVSLRNAIELVKQEELAALISFTDEQLSRLLGRKVNLAVAGLNPHASEGGMFGTEEQNEIEPAIEKCQTAGIDVTGPFSPDTVFLRGFRGEFDGVISCYHDQATIAVKSLSFGSSVNVTLGLPLIRTSVDHGTAFDIAGKNVADASSMGAAIKLAAELAHVRRNAVESP
jgi:4-hydroxythreonine-4-phosphate dehydrogenase